MKKKTWIIPPPGNLAQLGIQAASSLREGSLHLGRSGGGTVEMSPKPYGAKRVGFRPKTEGR